MLHTALLSTSSRMLTQTPVPRVATVPSILRPRRRALAAIRSYADSGPGARTSPAPAATATADARRNILVAVGQPQATKEAVQWALGNFARPGDVLHLLECVPPYSEDEVLSLALDDVAEVGLPSSLADPCALWEQHHSAPNWHRQMEERYGEDLRAAQVPYQLHLVQDEGASTKAGIANVLSKAAESLGSAAVVLTSRSRGGLSELLQGSVANSLMHSCDKPVAILHVDGSARKASKRAARREGHAVVATAASGAGSGAAVAVSTTLHLADEEAKAETRAAAEAKPRGRSILVADDGSELTLEVCKWTIDNLVQQGDTIQLVHVIPCLPPVATFAPFEYGAPLGWPTITEEQAVQEEQMWRESQAERLRTIEDCCKFDMMQITTVVNYTQDPAMTIGYDLCLAAARSDAKAVVMAARHHGTVDELLFGSVANIVAHHCEQPVVLLHF